MMSGTAKDRSENMSKIGLGTYASTFQKSLHALHRISSKMVLTSARAVATPRGTEKRLSGELSLVTIIVWVSNIYLMDIDYYI